MSATPMMQQYQSIRRTLPEGTLLLFRLGDFYELFFEDAKVAAPILNVALTKRNGMPMCGVPFHAAEAYIGKLIKAGHRVAICDQISDPQPGRIVERQVSQIISPGTVSDLHLLESRQNNFLAAVGRQPSGAEKKPSRKEHKERFGLALLDVSTGEFRVTEVYSLGVLEDELARFNPSEVLIPDSDQDLIRRIPGALSYDGYVFQLDHASYLLREQFGVQSLDGFGCGDMAVAIGAAGAVIHYLKHQLRRRTTHIQSLGVFLSDQYVALDATTQQNLELIRSKGASGDTSLLAALDRTLTPMGARLLRQWVLKPLRSVPAIRRRQEMIRQFLDQPFLLNAVRETLRDVRDVERILGRLSQVNGNARDVTALRLSLECLPDLKHHLAALAKATLADGEDVLLNQISAGIRELPDLVALLADALVEEPPALIKEGGIFRRG
ncbi:MAG: DNA mismatch repair protein MutS, partial [Verrucomicrobia bacterium]|nr:DNA mismatch repair protein MutS [Verrucomicrobiota bacterium]